MEVSFVETMRGTLATPDGGRATIEFEVVARAPSALQFARDGRLELKGLLRAPRWTDEAPCSGTLLLSPRRLAYALQFTARDGRTLQLEAEKTPRLGGLLESMTRMPAQLSAQGERLGEGTMRFDLRELVPFLTSWLPLRRTAQRALDARRRGRERQLLEASR